MSLQSILDIAARGNETTLIDEEITEERLRQCLPSIRERIAFYREYPDIFIDHIKGEDSTFEFFYYQRIFLRSVMRHRKVYATFSRGFSKSFLSVMALMLKCILYPNNYMFITTGGKIIIV